jgi:hypothetical protein
MNLLTPDNDLPAGTGWVRELVMGHCRRKFDSGRCSPTIIAHLCVACLLLASSNLGYAQQDSRLSTRSIETYLHMLDAESFRIRESGRQGLSEMGLEAVRPLAIQILTGSPESAWRCKQALESIGIQGDEETFLKTVAVLKLLYVGTSDSMLGRVSDLEMHWKLEQKRSILRQLQEKGARVVDNSNTVAINDQQLMWQVVDGVVIPTSSTFNSDRLMSAREENHEKRQRPLEESIEEIDRILASPIDENRLRLFGAAALENSVSAAEQPRSELDAEIFFELQAQRRFAMPLRGQLLNGNQRLPVDGIVIGLDDQWRGSASDLHRLPALVDLRRIELDQIDLPEDQVQAISKAVSLTSLQIVGNQLNSSKLAPLMTLPQVQDVEFVKRKMNAAELEVLPQLPRLVELVFNKAEISSSALESLSDCRRLHSIAFVEMKIASDMLASIARIPNLRLLRLDLCKFNIRDYRDLKGKRPEIDIHFSPTAFLGVRDSLNRTARGCEISQVIPNSGADRGGMKAGDIVRQIGEQTVDSFEDLRLHVSQYQAGDELDVLVSRDGSEIRLKIQLTPFEAETVN